MDWRGPMKLDRRTLLKGVFGLGATLAGSRWIGEPDAFADNPTVNFGAHPAMENYVLAARDWTSKYQVTTNLQWFAAGGASNDALLAGKIDVNTPGAGPLIALNSALPGKFAVIMLWDQGYNENATFVRPDSPYRSIQDLKGKKMGVLVGSGSFLALGVHLQELGLKFEDFQIVNLPGENLAAAVSARAIDAATVWEPLGVLAEGRNLGRVVARFPETGGDGTFVQVRTDTLPRLRPTLVRMVAGLLDTQAFIRNHPSEAARLITAELAKTGLDVPWQAFETVIKERYRLQPEFTPIVREFLNKQTAVALGTGRIKQAPKFTLITDILEEAKRLRS
jgi:ABC-type nitrate/sulfonate/bicarbonate transport system substrate-binding protein